MLPDPRRNTSDNQNRSYQDRPKLNMKRSQIVRRPGSRRDRGQFQDQKAISEPPMILVDPLSGVDATENRPCEEVLCYTHKGLEDDSDIGD